MCGGKDVAFVEAVFILFDATFSAPLVASREPLLGIGIIYIFGVHILQLLMKYSFLIFIIFLSLNVFCQEKEQRVPRDLAKHLVSIEAKEYRPTNLKLPFTSVKIIDYRFDTSKVGFSRSNDAYKDNRFIFSYYNFKRLTLKTSLRQSVQDFYNDYYENCFSKDSAELLIVIKRFWADPFPNKQTSRQQTSVDPESTFDLHIQFEFLMNRNGLYLPLKRVDTVFQINSIAQDVELLDFKEKKYNIYEYALIKTFESLNYQLYADRFDFSKNKKTLAELNNFNERRFSYPILKDTIWKEGVYMNFNEFRNNQPSIIKYTIEKNKKIGKIVYNITRGNERTQILKYWGYCDGKKIYTGEWEYPLSRIGNTFEFFTYRLDYFKDITPALIPGGVFVQAFKGGTTKEKVLEPFQIDMETGKIY